MTVEATGVFHSYQPADDLLAESLAGIVFADASELVVTHVAAATGARTVLAEGTDYTIAGDGLAGTATITALDSWPAGDLFEIQRVTPRTQDTDLPVLEAVSPRAVEAELDRLTRVDQEQDRHVNELQQRALQVPAGETAPEVASLQDSNGKLLAVVDGKIAPIDGDVAAAADSAAAAADAAAAAESSANAAAAEAENAALSVEQAQAQVTLAEQAQADAAAEVAAAQAAASDAESARDLAQAAAELAGDYGDMKVYRTWALLNAVTGTAGDMATVLTDTGTHTDPVVGGTVSNSGIFSYVASPAGWERIGNTSAADAAASAASASGTVERVFGYPDVGTGLAATAVGEKFRVVSPEAGVADAEYSVSASPNLYNPAAKQTGKYVASNGTVANDAAWACTAFIDVSALATGASITISANANKRVGLAFYGSASSGSYVADSYNAGTVAAGTPLTVTKPAGANFIVVNLSSNTISEPSQVQIEAGSTATTYYPYGAKISTLVREFAAYPVVVRAKDYEQDVTSPNLYNSANPAMRRAGFYIGSGGAAGTVQPASGWGFAAVPVTPGQRITISTNSARREGLAFYTGVPATGTYIPGTYDANMGNPYTVTVPAGAAYIGVNLYSTSIVEPTEVQIELGNTATEYQPFGEYTKVKRGDIYPPLPSPASGEATVYLAPAGTGNSYVQSDLSGATIRRDFNAFPSQTNVSVLPVCLNFTADRVNGAVVRSVNDDIAPDHILGTTLGANHGWTISLCTAAGHGKVQADQGSIWSNGGNQFVLVQVLSSSTLLIAHRTSNTAPGTGTYTHVSGATNTGNIVVTVSAAGQWYPPFQNYQMRVIVDGSLVADRDTTLTYRDTVQFVESYDILDRSEVVAWWEANGASGVLRPSGRDPSCRVTICYEFDRYGQLTIYRDFTALKAMAVQDLMGIQAQRVGGTTHYYIPQTLPFTQGGQNFNYALKEVANRLSANAYGSNFITPARCEASGPLADRFLALNGSDHVFAMGFLPVGATGLTERRANCASYVWEVRGSSDKVYARFLDKGSYTMAAGETYSTIAYRWIGPKPSARTASYPVFAQGRAYFFADWHDFTGRDQIELPPEFLGHEYTVIGSKNATVVGALMNGAMTVNVASAGSYGFIYIERN